ncbi:MAG: hypothetical protein VKK07_10140 [Merismopediaceae bacterium]|nr:hypothetical protein [Merismopediaceae bacterium]
MIKFLTNWWQVEKIKQAIRRQNFSQAEKLIRFRQQQKIKLSLLEQLFLQNINLQGNIEEKNKQLLTLESIVKLSQKFLEPNQNFIWYIEDCFKFIDHDPFKLQCTGIDFDVFESLETNLVDYLKSEINNKNLSSRQVKIELKKAKEDLERLKKGDDPDYDAKFSPHVYLIQYFLDNVYCNYLALFLIYRSGYFNEQLKILDIAAGPSTMLFGLNLFTQSLSKFVDVSQFNFSYYSLEKQVSLQIQGSKFWRYYLNTQTQPINAYCQFNTKDLFEYKNFKHQLPKTFFDFIVISHCFFYDDENREQSYSIYKNIFQQCLSSQGKVLLIIQRNKLYKTYNSFPEENIQVENQAVNNFLKLLGLELIWYKYLTSTGQRTVMKSGFSTFASKNLRKQNYLSILKQKYFDQQFISDYVIDDFVIFTQVSK